MLDIILPRCCVLCRDVGPGLCAACAAELPPAPGILVPPSMDDCWALLAYESTAARLVAELKYRNHRDAFSCVGRAMSVFVRRSPVAVDAVTWAPTSAARRRRRGYDQAEVLAAAIARTSSPSAVRTAAATARRMALSNPALNLAPFGRWTLRDKAAQRR